MYFPYLRGRQYELLALREMLELKKLSDKIIPLVEPVKLSSTLVSTIGAFDNNNRKIAIITNPQVGNFDNELREEKNQKNMDAYFSLVDNSDDILYVHILNAQSNPDEFIKRYGKNMGIICKDKDTLPIYEDFFLDEEVKYCFIPDESSFRRRIRKNKVLLANRFNKLDRNYDYIAKDDEFFSDDHLYYLEDNYVGFSDYSIIGDEYSDTGFAPYAVAIHIVYFDNDYSFRIKHFVSDSNDDISDPARKFQEALSKLIAWNKEKHYETEAMKQFEDLFDKENYPGLGTVKKLSLMHHLELVGTYLDDKRGVI